MTVIPQRRQPDACDQKLLELLRPWGRHVVNARCDNCDRILGQLEAPHPEMFASVDILNPETGSRPSIRRGYAGLTQFGFPEQSDPSGCITFRCKCGADIQRNKVRLVPPFVRAAAAGTSIRL